MSPHPGRRPLAPLFWLALGTFAIGTEGFMIAPLLPDLAADLSVGIGTAGQLVAVFALTYAISSPILTTLTGAVPRRRLLIAAMAAFALANVVACAAPTYWALMGARILLAIAAGLYVPNANALASVLLEPERRGTALSIVSGGTSIAIALGVPLGALIGDRFGWRLTFAGVGILAVIATAGLFRLGRPADPGVSTVTLRQRAGVVRQRNVLRSLFVTMLWGTGAYSVYTYLAIYLTATTGWAGTPVSVVLFLWGVSAAAGLLLGGRSTDRWGYRPVIVVSLCILSIAFAALSLCAELLPPASARIPVLVVIVLWGVSAWSFFPAQQASLIEAAGIEFASIVLSLNASFMFLGFSLGAVAGALALAHGGALNLGWVGAAWVVLALHLAVAIRRAGFGDPATGTWPTGFRSISQATSGFRDGQVRK